MFNGDIKVIEKSLINYAMDMRKRISYNTRANYCSAVIAFYAMNDVLLNRKKIYKYLGEYEKVHRDRAYTTEEIAKLLQFCDQRLKAIVLFLASSGSRLGSLPTLRVGNLVPISEYKLYKITIYESSREEYYTFCTPEAGERLMNTFNSGNGVAKNWARILRSFVNNLMSTTKRIALTIPGP